MPEPPAACGEGSTPTLGDLGEWRLLERLRAFAPPGQFDDDAALIEERAGGVLVVNTDVLVEGVHFNDATMGPGDLGWRAAAANLSDLAAMGCREVVGLTVGLVAPPRTPWAWVEGVYGGLTAALATTGAPLLGGDCSSGSERLLAVTALGRLGPQGPIRRQDGRAGDVLVCSGLHGLSRLGLALLLEQPLHGLITGSIAATDLPEDLRQRAIAAHRRPQARLDVVAALEQSQPPGDPWRVGGTDSSDGLAAALTAIAGTSGCDALLDRSALPIDPAMAPLREATDWCLGGGEDFELVLALPERWAQRLQACLPGVHCLGRLVAGTGRLLWQGTEEPLHGPAGFRHFG
jgi:thiamine-monophosphate kinase